MHWINSSRIKSDFLLLLVAIIWGTAFVAQRIAAQQVNLYTFNGLRFLLASAFLIPILQLRKMNSLSSRFDREIGLGVLLAGIVLFIGAALQQAGLQWTSAGNAGFITGLYVVFVPLLSTLLLGRKPRILNLLAVFIAAMGLYMLSTGGSFTITHGDSYELGGALLWAIHVILIGSLANKVHPLQIAAGQNIVCGGLSLAFAFLATNFSPWYGLAEKLWAILFTGLLSIGIGYTLQIVAQKETPPTDAAVILSMEAVVAAFSSWLILDERLSAVQMCGCFLMLTAMMLAQLRSGSQASQQ